MTIKLMMMLVRIVMRRKLLGSNNTEKLPMLMIQISIVRYAWRGSAEFPEIRAGVFYYSSEFRAGEIESKILFGELQLRKGR